MQGNTQQQEKQKEMILKLNLEQDAELRSSVKSMVNDQLISIVREEFTALVKEEIQKRLDAMTRHLTHGNWQHLVQNAIDSIIREKLRDNNIMKYGDFSKEILEILTKILSQRLDDKEFDKIVQKASSDRLRILLNNH